MFELDEYFNRVYLKEKNHSKKTHKELFTKCQSICPDGKILGEKIVEYSRKMTELTMFKEAEEFINFVCTQII